jgi:serine/threonine protein kinase
MSRELEAGAEIDGFLIGERLHAGNMGDVFSVTKPGIERPLLIKVPRIGSAASESLIGFEMEAMISPNLQGPSVAACLAVGELSRAPYLVFERIEGQNLEQLVSSAPLPAARVAEIGAAIADALHDVHQQRVVHLDLKPSNILLRPDGRAVLIDFGLSHHERYPDLLAEETRFRAGSAPYVSPEQLLGVRSDRRSDLFALGVVLYELATARLPFGEPDSDVRNRFWLDPIPPTQLAPEVPPWLQEIVLRCLEPKALERYQTAAHVAFDLRHPEQVALTGRATKASRAGLVAQAKRFLSAHGEHAARLRSPPPMPQRTPIVLAAVDTSHLDDERHPAIRFAVSQFLASSQEFRLICVSVIAPTASALEHHVQLRHWAEPLALPVQRLSLHVLESESPSDVLVELARYNNADLLIMGAPAEGGRAWSQSTASSVVGKVSCSVHLVRVPKRT